MHFTNSLVNLKPAHKLGVRVPFYRDITNQFPDEVLAVKSTLAGAFVDSDGADGSFLPF